MLLDQFLEGFLTSSVASTAGVTAWWQDEHLVFELELPGYDKGKISVVREDDTLFIEATKGDFEEKGRKYIVRDSLYPEKMCKRYLLPKELDSEKTEAEYSEGILRISIPKAENRISKKIAIK